MKKNLSSDTVLRDLDPFGWCPECVTFGNACDECADEAEFFVTFN